MVPPGGGKRKRGDRSWSGDSSHDGQRPSPHRPGNLHLAQHTQGQPSTFGRDQQENRGRGGRRPSRGGRGSGNPQSPTSSRIPTSAPVSKLVSPSVQVVGDPTPYYQPNGVHDKATNQNLMNSSNYEVAPTTRPFDYHLLTDEVCQSWESSGRLSMMETGKQLRDNGDNVELGTLFQELLFAGMSGRIPPSEAGRMIKEIAWSGESAADLDMNIEADFSANLSDSQAVFLDTISVFVAETPISPQAFSAVVQSSGIPPALLRQELDVKFLEKLGLIRTTFGRMAVRKTTNVLYRQANFNLLREESEGFAKLMTELFTTSGNEPPTSDVVEDTVERVKAMIGSFDLDVGRALDVVLDVFGAVLVKQFRFFVKFLRASPWWPREEHQRRGRKNIPVLSGLPQWALPGSVAWHLDDVQKAELSQLTSDRDRHFWARARGVGLKAFYEVGRERVTDAETDFGLPAATTDCTELSSKEKFVREWIRQTGTFPPRGNEDAAQLLGFKLRFYSSSAARTENDTLPDNLIYLSALLIKVGFISLKDLYPHIWKTDEDMEALQQEKVNEKAERERAARPGQGAKNALLMAGALADDTLPIPARLRDNGTRAATPIKEAESDKAAPSTEKKNGLPGPADQKIPLLKSLLAIGAIPESLFILGKFPWIVDLYPELPEYISRIIHRALSKVYGSIKPVASNTTLQHQKASGDSDLAAVLKGHVKLTQAPPRKILRWALLDRDDSGSDGLDYRFYWDEWSDNIPVCQTVDDVFTLCETLLNLTGIKIGKDPALLVKFARIGKHSIAEDTSSFNQQRWSELCKRLLVPALSLTKSNPGVVNEVYELLNNFSIETRYLIYQEWSSGRTSKTSDIKTATDQAKAETRDTLKRLSRTNVRPMARALAKIAYSNPHIVINTAISQIEVYDNLAEVFVEGARYFTDLGYDVLTWSLISALGRAGRSRVQESGLVTSRWLTALAYFAGKMFKRYTIMRPAPVLQYVADQLIKGNPTDLIVLEQIILFMAGIVTDASYNDAQLLAMGGGELLRSQTILQLLDKRHESRITSRRLMRSLKESDLAGKLLLAIAIQRQASVFNLEDTNAPLKLLGNLYDEIQRVLTQYLDLLHSNLSPEEYESAVPGVAQLIASYKVQPEVAFWISRPTIARQMAEFDKALHINGVQKKAEDILVKDLGSGDVDMADQLDGAGEDEGEALDTQPVTESAATPTAAEINGIISNAESPGKPPAEDATPPDEQQYQWHSVLQPIMDSIKSSLPTEVVNVIGLGFYVTFWQLALYDVTIPGKSYEDELSRQHKRIATISSNRADVTAAGARKREAEKKQISNLIDRLLTENKEHLKAFAESKARLSREKGNWFTGMYGKAELLNSALMEYCFLPRILLSPLDSLFCFKFLKFLHTSGTSNFRTMGFYDSIFRQNRLTSLIFMCTSKEADNLGRFLNEILRDLARWQKDRNIYEKEAWGSKKTLPGFARKVSSSGKSESFLHYEDFRRILYKWHQHLCNALQTCLSSSEYMHIRNAISVLKAVAENFPVISFHGLQMQKLISELGKFDQGDIKVPSLSLMADLNKASKSWIIPQAFRKGKEKVPEESTLTPKDSTPAPSGQLLNAEASEFKPSPLSG
jgi:THO complex subunit 2